MLGLLYADGTVETVDAVKLRSNPLTGVLEEVETVLVDRCGFSLPETAAGGRRSRRYLEKKKDETTHCGREDEQTHGILAQGYRPSRVRTCSLAVSAFEHGQVD